MAENKTVIAFYKLFYIIFHNLVLLNQNQIFTNVGIENTIGDKGFVSSNIKGDINTLTITSKVTATDVIKGHKTQIVSVSSDSTLTAESNSVILIDASTSLVSVTLPDIDLIDGYLLTIKKIDTTTKNVVLEPVTGQLIDNATKKTITEPYISLTIVSNNGNWWII